MRLKNEFARRPCAPFGLFAYWTPLAARAPSISRPFTCIAWWPPPAALIACSVALVSLLPTFPRSPSMDPVTVPMESPALNFLAAYSPHPRSSPLIGALASRNAPEGRTFSQGFHFSSPPQPRLNCISHPPPGMSRPRLHLSSSFSLATVSFPVSSCTLCRLICFSSFWTLCCADRLFLSYVFVIIGVCSRGWPLPVAALVTATSPPHRLCDLSSRSCSATRFCFSADVSFTASALSSLLLCSSIVIAHVLSRPVIRPRRALSARLSRHLTLSSSPAKPLASRFCWARACLDATTISCISIISLIILFSRRRRFSSFIPSAALHLGRIPPSTRSTASQSASSTTSPCSAAWNARTALLTAVRHWHQSRIGVALVGFSFGMSLSSCSIFTLILFV